MSHVATCMRANIEGYGTMTFASSRLEAHDVRGYRATSYIVHPRHAFVTPTLYGDSLISYASN